MASHTDPAELVRLLGFTPIPSNGEGLSPRTRGAFEQWLGDLGLATQKSDDSDFNTEQDPPHE